MHNLVQVRPVATPNTNCQINHKLDLSKLTKTRIIDIIKYNKLFQVPFI